MKTINYLIASAVVAFVGVACSQENGQDNGQAQQDKQPTPANAIVSEKQKFLIDTITTFIFKVYTSESIASTFFITSGTFGVMSVWGYFTKTDLTRWGNILFMGVIGLIIASLVNQFLLKSTMLYWITTCVGVLTFVGLTAYDTQKIKNANIIGNEGSDEDHKESIIGGLILYLVFINLFLYLLRIFGRRK